MAVVKIVAIILALFVPFVVAPQVDASRELTGWQIGGTIVGTSSIEWTVTEGRKQRGKDWLVVWTLCDLADGRIWSRNASVNYVLANGGTLVQGTYGATRCEGRIANWGKLPDYTILDSTVVVMP